MLQDWLHASTLQTRNTYMFTEFHSTLSNYTCSIQHKTISLLFFRHCLSKKNNQITLLTIDGCGKGTWWKRRELQLSLEGRRDNLVSCTQQLPSHWKPQWRNAQIFTTKHPEERKSSEQKQRNPLHVKGTFREWNDWPQQKHCKTTKAQDNPTYD